MTRYIGIIVGMMRNRRAYFYDRGYTVNINSQFSVTKQHAEIYDCAQTLYAVSGEKELANRMHATA